MASRDTSLEDEIEFLQSFYPSEEEFSWDANNRHGSVCVTIEADGGLDVSVQWNSYPLEGHIRAHVLYLPPVTLSFSLPHGYPHSCPPTYTLRSNWLNFISLSQLCKKLDEMWVEGQVVLYDWIQFISAESLDYLSIRSPYVIDVLDPSIVPLDVWDERAIQDISHLAKHTQHLSLIHI